ncbi:ankyrin repeat and BTB/POZ domain-containing protein 1-like isoform X2 [Zootermopsis nevadensis]|uniref:ankyrin repeat and BTB/POZ domain-containing protein 1-like isoform X2 n=1 Tax=Zootermopsis nevadensis TaxID=136037 RepID=UPI000B8EAB24|nr:ankyrin repeat and BTB/POZ domain-containing protein 1-like isoform X2 [Zootermopsis nevadensis]
MFGVAMDLNDLFSSCKRGDLSRIEYLVEHKEVNVNVRDKWDSTPLLLETGELSDVTFVVNGSTFHVHRCVLAARCIYFCDKFQTRWQDRRIINIENNLVHPSAFKSLMQYIYTARLETHIDGVDDCIRLAVQCRLSLLKAELEDMVKKVNSFECTKPGTSVKTLTLESAELAAKLQQDLGVLGVQALPQELRTWVTGVDLPLMPIVPLFLVDICFCVCGCKFYCHKAFFCGRSEYFNALLRDHFSETTADDGNPMVTIRNVPVEAFASVVYYIYTNAVQAREEYILDVLCAADMYLLPGLKRGCGVVLGSCLSTENVVNRLKTARLFQLPQLEDQCTRFISLHIDKVVHDEGLHDLIIQDATEVKGRQETDSIPVIDDIRYHIRSDVKAVSKLQEASEKLQMIDRLLEDLGLDA